MPVFPTISSKEQTSKEAASGGDQIPSGSLDKGGKQQPTSQSSGKVDTTKLSRSLSSTVQLNIGVKKRALLVAVNLTTMLASLIVTWHALYSYMFRSSQPYSFWFSLVSKSFLFTLLLHLDVFIVLFSGFFGLGSGTGFVGALRENVSLLKLYQAFIGVIAIILAAIAGVALVQASLRCFGFSVESFRDWHHNDYYRCDLGNPSWERCSVPASCCKTGNSSEESAKDVNMNCAHGVLLKSDQAAWDVVYTRSCVDACHT
ncbi:hypothetical protein V5799_029799 [Amblyomma americanum]|uniref:Tetraspanin n=1 Tax=Amblyomma americanum TaxID=6943 RepID=A0AAQ4EQK2_AMBAM